MTKPDEAAAEAQARAGLGAAGLPAGDRHGGADGSLALPAPANVTAEPGAGHVMLSWDPVPGAAGYVIERTGVEHTGEDGDGPKILAHGGSDVLAVSGPPFADTGLADDTAIYRYRIGAVAGAEYPVWSWSAPVQSATRPGDPGPVLVRVDASAVTGTLNRVWRMIGSERLSQLLLGSDEGGTERDAGKQIAAEFADALRLAHDELGATMVRAHAILHDDNAVVSRDAAGALHFDFGRVDAIYDQVLGYGLRPVVELSFMPAALARDPQQTVFAYRGIISPPADWAEWRQLVTALAAPPGASGTASTRWRGGRSRYGTNRTWPCSGRARWPNTCGCTRSRRGRSRRSTRGCASAAPPRPPLSGSSRSPRTPRGTTCRWTSSARTPTATSRWMCGPRCSGTAWTAFPSGGPNGASARPTTARCTTGRSARRSCFPGSSTRSGGSTPWRTG